MNRCLAVWPAGEGLRAAVFNDRAVAHFAAPRSVGHLNARVLIFAVVFVERDLLVAGFKAAVVTSHESQAGEYFPQAFDPR